MTDDTTQADATAANAAETTQTPEVTEQQAATTTAPVAPRAFTQEEVDKIVADRLRRERRAFERKLQEAAQTPPAEPDEVTKKARELLQQEQIKAQQQEIVESFKDQLDAAREQFKDYDAIVTSEDLTITPVMMEAAMSADNGAMVLYALGQKPEDAERIARLAPARQAVEIGKLAAKLQSEPLVKKVSSAPPPVTPVKTAASPAKTYDTTDPRSTADMSVSEWIAAERARQTAALRAKLGR
jgi:hypothetical protein